MAVTVKAEYTHQRPGEEYRGLAGYYIPLKEARLKFEGREVLYIVGRAVLESSCCSSGGWSYITVPGYILDWQAKRSPAGLAVTTVEPVADGEARGRITALLQDLEDVESVTFW